MTLRNEYFKLGLEQCSVKRLEDFYLFIEKQCICLVIQMYLMETYFQILLSEINLQIVYVSRIIC